MILETITRQNALYQLFGGLSFTLKRGQNVINIECNIFPTVLVYSILNTWKLLNETSIITGSEGSTFDLHC